MTTTTSAHTLPLVPGRWAIDLAHSTIGFTIRHLGVAKVRGRFTEFDVDLAIGETADDSWVSARVDLASIDTGNRDRDAHVRSEEMVDVAARPAMAFRSLGVQGDGSDWTLDGELTIGDITGPFSLDVELGGVGDFVDGTRHAGFEATGEIRRKDFDLGFGPLGAFLGDVVKIELDLEFIEPT